MARLPDVSDMGREPSIRPAGAPQINEPSLQEYSNLGAGVAAAGDAFMEVKRYDDKIQAEDAQNRLQQKIIDLRNGENGYKQIKSRGVIERPVYKEYNDQFNEYVDQISESLSNDEQRSYFKRRADVQRLRFNTDLTNHIQTERNAHTKQTIESGVALELQTAGEHWSEPGTINLSIARSKHLIDLQSDIDGLPYTARKALKLKATSDIHGNVIDQAISNEQPEYAKAYFNKHKKDIDSTVHDDITRLIRNTELKVLSQEASDEIMSLSLPEEDALAKVRKQYKGDEEKAIVDAVKTRYREERDADRQSEVEATDTAWQIYNDSIDSGISDPYNQIPQNILDSMDQKSRSVLKNTAKGKKFESGGPDYYYLKQLAMDDPVAFRDRRKTNILSYQLSSGDAKELIKLQTEDVNIDYFQSKQQMVDQAVGALDLDPKDRFEDNSKGERVRQFYNRVRQEQEAYQRDTGKPMDDKALQELLDRLTIKVIRERSYWFDAEEPVAEIKIEGVPDDQVDDYAKALRDNGYPVTKENILKLYHAP